MDLRPLFGAARRRRERRRCTSRRCTGMRPSWVRFWRQGATWRPGTSTDRRRCRSLAAELCGRCSARPTSANRPPLGQRRAPPALRGGPNRGWSMRQFVGRHLQKRTCHPRNWLQTIVDLVRLAGLVAAFIRTTRVVQENVPCSETTGVPRS
ncbi:hypothetical protein T484DRAFT_1922958 [Baffinella frigidus]|nr:hypothetical protein T484DRAFT_1922958 [Cryptophyta sp. CCMP2293]